MKQELEWSTWAGRFTGVALRRQRELLDETTTETPPSPGYAAVVVSELSPHPTIEQYDNFQSLVERLRRQGPDECVIPVCGLILGLSASSNHPDLRYVQHPNGSFVPLFELSPDMPLDYRASRVSEMASITDEQIARLTPEADMFYPIQPEIEDEIGALDAIDNESVDQGEY